MKPVGVDRPKTQLISEIAGVQDFRPLVPSGTGPIGWWRRYDKDDWDAKRKMEVKEYFVHRKGDKMHWEMFNGTGFAYNEKTITHFADILPPVI